MRSATYTVVFLPQFTTISERYHWRIAIQCTQQRHERAFRRCRVSKGLDARRIGPPLPRLKMLKKPSQDRSLPRLEVGNIRQYCLAYGAGRIS
uniref:Uncharacterized protein n=1 Tax=Alloyangia mangrovi TaxID=1779329 RepID=A0A2A3K0G2_9RHOB